MRIVTRRLDDFFIPSRIDFMKRRKKVGGKRGNPSIYITRLYIKVHPYFPRPACSSSRKKKKPNLVNLNRSWAFRPLVVLFVPSLVRVRAV